VGRGRLSFSTNGTKLEIKTCNQDAAQTWIPGPYQSSD
jgi:hypothetical protein